MGNQFLKGLQRPAIMPEGSSLPDYSEANDGDALVIEDGEPVWGAVDALPEIEETDEGKVLAVDQGEAVWADAPSGLPEIEESDEGKILTVVGEANTTELFPEQSLTVQGTDEQIIPATVQNANLSLFVDGETVRCTVDGTDYEAVIESGLAVFDVDESAYILRVTDSTMTFTAPSEGTYTVSAVIVEDERIYSAQWAEAQDGGNILELSAGTNTQIASLFQSVITTCATSGFDTAGAYDNLSNVPREDFDAIRSCASKVADGTPCSLKVADDYCSILHCTYTKSLIKLEGVMPFYLLDHPQLGAHILRITFQMYVTGTLHAEAVCEELYNASSQT